MTLRSALLAATATAALGAANAASLDGWYVGLEGGANWIDDWSHTFNSVGTTIAGQAGFDTGWTVLATVGHAWRNRFRLEFEAGYRDNDVDVFSTGGAPVTTFSGDLWEVTLMANVLYDVPLTNDLTLSVGAGAGGEWPLRQVDLVDVIEHDLGVVMDISDFVYVLDFGEVIGAGKPKEVATNPKVVEAYIGEE